MIDCIIFNIQSTLINKFYLSKKIVIFKYISLTFINLISNLCIIPT